MSSDIGAVSPVQIVIGALEGARSPSDPQDLRATEPQSPEGESGSNAAAPPDLTAARLTELTDGAYNEHARLSIDRDDEADAFVYRILDNRSGEIIRQFPAEDMLDLLAYLGEHSGLVIDRKV
ncbi:MAG: flagellar protein FlaG [Maricaulaceae bacterium]|jgi:flagellar protein FlaG